MIIDAANAEAAPKALRDPTVDAPRILIVDDDRINRAMLARLLQRHGYATAEAGDGVAALEKIAQTKFDLLLLDVVMPGIDGFEVLRRLRAEKSVSELPVIMVTASDDSEQVVQAFRQGVNDHVTKPYDDQIALARIDTQVRLKQAQAALRESEERYALAASGANDGIWDWNLTTDDVYYSPRWRKMVGLDGSLGAGTLRDWLDRIHSDDRDRWAAELAAHRQGETPHFEVEIRMLHENGAYRWMLCRGLAVRDRRGEVQRIAGSLTDITEGKVADALTGLPNRLLFMERLRRSVERCSRTSEMFAVLYVDIDNFKRINDSLGHAAGDELLVTVARRLENSVRAGETIVARLGGDEFALLAESIDCQEDAERLSQRLLDALSLPLSVQGREVHVSASIGITIGRAPPGKPEDFMREADTAMYEAKCQGKSGFRLYNLAMHEALRRRIDTESDLRCALDRGEFVLHYQPIIVLATRRVVGFEALLRWRHPHRGLLLPAEFLSIAEETGLIVPLGAWVVREACRQVQAWQSVAMRPDPVAISVNVSARQLNQLDFFDCVAASIRETAIDAQCLKLEITETAIMRDLDDRAATLHRLRDLGVHVCIDDFGTGYSSLAYLHRLPCDIIKIDRSFVNTMERSAENEAIVGTIVALANSLKLDVVAEGVETSEQCARLQSMGIKFGQGFLFMPPMDFDRAQHLIDASDWAGRCASTS